MESDKRKMKNKNKKIGRTMLNCPLLTRVGTLIKALVRTNLDKLKFENGLLWPQKTELFETLSRVNKFENTGYVHW